METARTVDMLTDNIIDMYIPMMDLSDLSYDFHKTKGKILAVECELILSKILNLIAIFMKNTTCVRNKDILKHYFNRYVNLKFSNGDAECLITLESKLSDTYNPEDTEIFIMKMSSSLKALHAFISEFDFNKTLISKVVFLGCLKKLESCIISMIFILKLGFKINDVLIELEGMHAKISF